LVLDSGRSGSGAAGHGKLSTVDDAGDISVCFVRGVGVNTSNAGAVLDPLLRDVGRLAVADDLAATLLASKDELAAKVEADQGRR
jgi:hypothetical protein